MHKDSVKTIAHSAIITAFTIAAALIWRDVIVDAINLFVPPSQELTYKLLAAVLATVIVVIGIFLLLKTEDEAEHVIDKLKHREKLKRVK